MNVNIKFTVLFLIFIRFTNNISINNENMNAIKTIEFDNKFDTNKFFLISFIQILSTIHCIKYISISFSKLSRYLSNT